MKYHTKTTESKRIGMFLSMFFILLLSTCLKAQLPSPPNPPRLVNDYTGMLTASQVSELEQRLVAYNDSTSTQILVLLVDDLQGYNIEQYATEIGHNWGVGQKGKDNGVVVLVKPKKGKERGQVNISPGYGMEKYITDATAKVIIDKEMIPAFKDNDYYTGINKAIDVIMDLCSGKFSQDEYTKKDGLPLWFIIIIIIAIILIFFKNDDQNYSSGGHRTIWMPMGGGFGSGGFGGGHSSGGGFGGFGGGGFGGGGASGSW